MENFLGVINPGFGFTKAGLIGAGGNLICRIAPSLVRFSEAGDDLRPQFTLSTDRRTNDRPPISWDGGCGDRPYAGKYRGQGKAIMALPLFAQLLWDDLPEASEVSLHVLVHDPASLQASLESLYGAHTIAHQGTAKRVKIVRPESRALVREGNGVLSAAEFAGRSTLFDLGTDTVICTATQQHRKLKFPAEICISGYGANGLGAILHSNYGDIVGHPNTPEMAAKLIMNPGKSDRYVVAIGQYLDLIEEKFIGTPATSGIESAVFTGGLLEGAVFRKVLLGRKRFCGAPIKILKNPQTADVLGLINDLRGTYATIAA